MLRGGVGCAESPRPRRVPTAWPQPTFGWPRVAACPEARSPAGNPPDASVLPSAASWGFASNGSTRRHLQEGNVAAPRGQAARAARIASSAAAAGN